MRILWLKTELLHPVDKGGKIRTYQMLKELKKQHHITYLTLDDGTASEDAVERAAEYSNELILVPHRISQKFSMDFYFELIKNTFSKFPYFMQKYVSQEMLNQIDRHTTNGTIDCVVCDFLMPSVNVPDKVNKPVVLFQHNVEAMIWQRYFEVQKNPVKRVYLKSQWRRTVDYEREACRRFDYVAAVSRNDSLSFKSEYGVSNVADVPTGVDTDFFTPNRKMKKDAFNLVFTGSMDWLPNEDAIQWFIKDVFPLIRLKIHNISFTIVGRNPFPSLIELSKNDPSLVVTGRVDDIRSFMDAASVYVVPVRIGGGTRLKIYEAMAMEVPIVSTTVGAEGLPVRDGEELLIRDSPQDFAEAVVRLLSQREFATELASRAADVVRNNFGWAKAAYDFTQICEKAVRARKMASLNLVAENT